MRTMVFKMERSGLVKEGQSIVVTEGRLPSAWYYTIEPAVAMSGNIPIGERLMVREGVVVKIEENQRGLYVTAQFDEN